MQTKTPTLAEQYLNQQPNAAEPIEPLRTDKLGRLVFQDGSLISTNALGESSVSSYSPSEWIAQELAARELGRDDRIRRKRMRRAFLKGTATYPKRVCRAYCDGWHSVLPW